MSDNSNLYKNISYSYDSFDFSGIILNPIIQSIQNTKKNIRRNNKYFLTEKYNEKHFNKVLNHMKMSHFSIIIEDIKNYNKLTEFQIAYLINLNENQKIEIIKMYNYMIETIENLHT